MRTVVLVHGAWHGPWCWAPVLAGLDELRVPTVAVELPGPDLHADADHVRSVLDTVDGGVVLVGHSYGGAVITDAGTHPAVEHLVFLAALVPDKGETITSISVDGGTTSELGDAMRISDDGTTTLDPERTPAVFYDDCDAADVERALALLRPQSMGSFTQAPRVVAWRERPATYIVCARDRALTPTFQRNMAGRIPGCAIVEVDASHSPFFSRPGEIVELVAGSA